MKKKAFMLLIVLSFAVLLAACGNSYEYINGDVDWYSTYSETPGTYISDAFYYSDDWFSDKPVSENKELALASMQLAASAVTDDKDGAGAAFLKNMGFEEVGFSDFSGADPAGFNYTWGKKKISSGSDTLTLVAVAVQSASLDMNVKNNGWKQNFTVNDPEANDPSGEHYAYALAVDKGIDDIVALGDSDNVKYWITGQSRGGAIANILAERLPEKLGDNNKGIFAYTFEAPATVDAESAQKVDCKYIHNYICNDDIVTMIPTWGMTRYGVTHDLRTKTTDAGLAEMLSKIGSEAAGLKARIVAEKTANRITEKFEQKIPSRSDYSAERTDQWTDPNGEKHSITYSYQDAFVDLMDFVFSGDGTNNPLKDLAGKKNELSDAVAHLTEGVRLEKAGKNPGQEYWAGAEIVYDAVKKEDAEEGTSPEKEDVYKMLSLAAPVLIDIPDDGSEADTSLLTDVIGYNKELTYSHQFDTIIARLKILAPQPER